MHKKKKSVELEEAAGTLWQYEGDKELLLVVKDTNKYMYVSLDTGRYLANVGGYLTTEEVVKDLHGYTLVPIELNNVLQEALLDVR